MIKAITFDCWNTLYKNPEDASLLTRRVDNFKEALWREGYEYGTDVIFQVFHGARKKAFLYQRVYGEDIAPQGQIDYVIDTLGLNNKIKNLRAIYDAYTGTLLETPPELNDGCQSILAYLAARYKLAVICNTGVTPGSIVREFMSKDGIKNYFSMLAFSDEVRFAKPNPRIFQYTLENLKIGPETAVHVGDDAITDVIGAKKAGMTAVWLAPGASWAVPECDYLIHNLGEMKTLF